MMQRVEEPPEVHPRTAARTINLAITHLVTERALTRRHVTAIIRVNIIPLRHFFEEFLERLLIAFLAVDSLLINA
jgi:hypothetical protein